MATVTARLDGWLEDEIKKFWARHGEGPSSALRLIAEEWWVLETFRHIEFREGVSGRRAGIRGGPDVWEVVLVAGPTRDLDALEGHFGGMVSREALAEALGYANRFPGYIQARIRENERIAELLSRAAPK